MGLKPKAVSNHASSSWLWIIVAATLLAPGSALAIGSCGATDQPMVSVSFAPGFWREGVKDAVFQDLRAGLASHHIETCRAEAGISRVPAATVRLTAAGLDAVRVVVEVHDTVTDKELSRDVDLSRVPSDGQSFAIALAADELVWASWAEIAIKGNTRKANAPPQLVAEVERSVQPAREVARHLGMQGSMEHYLRGLTQFGPDVLFEFSWAPRFGLRVIGGYRQGLDVRAPDGRIQSMSIGMNLDVTAIVLRTRHLELTWTFGERSAWHRFKGGPSSKVLGGELIGLTLYARTGLIAAIRMGGPLWLEVGATAGFPLRALEATDSGQVVAGVSGLEQSALIAITGEL